MGLGEEGRGTPELPLDLPLRIHCDTIHHVMLNISSYSLRIFLTSCLKFKLSSLLKKANKRPQLGPILFCQAFPFCVVWNYMYFILH